MIGTIYQHAALIDTAAVLALLDPAEPFHSAAKAYFEEQSEIVWASLNVTAHEAFTRARYGGLDCDRALARFGLLRLESIRVLTFSEDDEQQACLTLKQYSDQRLSFHDALCAAVMKRLGIYRVFSFDRDFLILGFELLPGIYK